MNGLEVRVGFIIYILLNMYVSACIRILYLVPTLNIVNNKRYRRNNQKRK